MKHALFSSGIPLTIVPRREGGAFTRRGEPVAVGLPFPRGVLQPPATGSAGGSERLEITDASGIVMPVQVSVLERWNDGSVRWALLRFCATTAPAGQAAVWCRAANAAGNDAEASRLSIRFGPEDSGAQICTGVLNGLISQSGLVVTPKASDIPRLIEAQVVDARRGPLRVEFDRYEVEESGPLYARIRLTGSAHTPAGCDVLALVFRLEFFSGLGAVRCSLAVTNPRRARHRGGIWELGDPNSVLIERATVRVVIAERGAQPLLRYSVAPDRPWRRENGPFALRQVSSGGECWNSVNHVSRNGVVPLLFRGYDTTAGETYERGLRATPIVQVEAEGGAVALAAERFWENFPKGIRADTGSLSLDLFPDWTPEPHEIQPGECKTHFFTFLFGDDPITEQPLAWARSPLLVTASPDTYVAGEALPFLPPAGGCGWAEAMLEAAIEGPNSFEAKRERIDEYGWRHFGDVYADHEAVDRKGRISHYNNQYDLVAGLAAQYFRHGDARWWALMDDLATHVQDIDIYHTQDDKATYSGGMFWHTAHYTDAGKSTHRSFPNAAGVVGGGPCVEHAYSTGLMLHYYLTGDVASREAAIGLADWIVAMDTGSTTPFRWFDKGPTGHASATASTLYHGPGRGAGNAILVLVNAHRLSDDVRFLRKAEELIHRCVHPEEDIDARNLLDAERRWSYTVFLQGLGRYLLHKAERSEFDESFSYARASLVRYARWIAAHEVFYLDHPEHLEYPTETWAAQELRKAEALVLAALCVPPPEQPPLIERADYFYRRSVDKLRETGSAWLTRPLAILLSCLGTVPWWHSSGCCTVPLLHDIAADFPPPGEFVPQRVRAVKRAKLTGAVCGGLVFAGALAAWLF